ncbi:uncharacterized protein METZ01_LOCUS450662, partial [marine metagenome]
FLVIILPPFMIGSPLCVLYVYRTAKSCDFYSYFIQISSQ